MIKITLLLSAIFIAIVYVMYLVYIKKQSYVKYSLIALIILVSIYNVLQTNSEDNTHKIVLAFNNKKK